MQSVLESLKHKHGNIFNGNVTIVAIPTHADFWKHEKWQGGHDHFIENNYARFVERYDERIRNFRAYLTKPNTHVTFIITRREENMKELRAVLAERYPDLQYTILHLPVPEADTEVYDVYHALASNRETLALSSLTA